MRRVLTLLMAVVPLAAAGCGIPKDALAINPQTLQDRQMQTRYFDTANETEILSASLALLQDLGYNLDASEAKLGLVVASKDRDATDGGQITAAIVVAALTGASTSVDRVQKIRCSVVTSPSGETGQRTAVRVTFQRIVWNTENQISRLEKLKDLKMYQEFFQKLSKSVFLEAHDI